LRTSSNRGSAQGVGGCIAERLSDCCLDKPGSQENIDEHAPPYHLGRLELHDLVDIVIDTKVPAGDALVSVKWLDEPVRPSL
jgi:hypothetical protein